MYLARLAAAAKRDAPIPEDLQSWLRAGIRDWLESDVSLDQALGMAGRRGTRTAKGQLIMTLRNGRIVDSALQLGAASKSEASVILARKWERLARGCKPMDSVDVLLQPAALLGPPGLGQHSIRKILADSD